MTNRDAVMASYNARYFDRRIVTGISPVHHIIQDMIFFVLLASTYDALKIIDNLKKALHLPESV